MGTTPSHQTTGKFISPSTGLGRDRSIEDKARPSAPLTVEGGRPFDDERARLSAAARVDSATGEGLKAAHGFGLDPVGAPRRFMPGYTGAPPRGPTDPFAKSPNLEAIQKVGGK